MPLKDKWVDKINDLDYIDANDINEIAHSVIDMEKKSVENVLYTPQTLTDEQKAQARENIGAMSDNLSAAIDASVTQYLVDNPVVNGMAATLRILLQTLFGSAVYTSDQSKNIALLNTVLTNQSTESYTITNNLVYVTNNNEQDTVICGNAYIATLSAVDGYTLDAVTVTMSGVNITATAYDGCGNITIHEVTGDIVIEAIASFKVFDDIVIGYSVSSYENALTIDSRGGGFNNRATIIPIGKYLQNGLTYKFSLGELTGYYYGVQIFTAHSSGLTFDYEFNALTSHANCPRIVDTGWKNVDYTYKAEAENLILAVNFKNSSSSNLTETDRAALLENFTIEVV